MYHAKNPPPQYESYTLTTAHPNYALYKSIMQAQSNNSSDLDGAVALQALKKVID